LNTNKKHEISSTDALLGAGHKSQRVMSPDLKQMRQSHKQWKQFFFQKLSTLNHDGMEDEVNPD